MAKAGRKPIERDEEVARFVWAKAAVKTSDVDIAKAIGINVPKLRDLYGDKLHEGRIVLFGKKLEDLVEGSKTSPKQLEILIGLMIDRPKGSAAAAKLGKKEEANVAAAKEAEDGAFRPVAQPKIELVR
jgi:hypothetical protein